MAAFYYLGILGNCSSGVLTDIRAELDARLRELGLDSPGSVDIFVGSPSGFRPPDFNCSAALCFDSASSEFAHIQALVETGVPIVPVATTRKDFTKQIPAPLLPLNGLTLDQHSVSQLVLGLLECAGLLPRQRRAFISYRRDSATDSAVQLYAELSARGFDVFLDTHKIHPGEVFQEMLWQRLCDCDVLAMLDTADYFASRWTNAEFGRALSRGLAFVRVGWPTVPLNPLAGAARNLELQDSDFDAGSAKLTNGALRKICDAVESARTTSVRTRFQGIVSTLRASLSKVGGTVNGISLRRNIVVTLANGKTIAAYPVLGVPTTLTLHNATLDKHPPPVAVVYDDVGIEEKSWHEHMKWVGAHVKHVVRLVPSYRSAWDFSDWHTT